MTSLDVRKQNRRMVAGSNGNGASTTCLRVREWVISGRKRGLTNSQIAAKSNGQLTAAQVNHILWKFDSSSHASVGAGRVA